MIAGALEVQLMADVARIRDDMQKATGFVTSGAKSMERAAAGVKAALGGIVAGLSVAALSNWIRGAIDGADSMSKLSQKIGVATHDIAGLQLAYKLSGAGAESMQTSIARLSKGLIDNNKGLEALGIRTKETGGAFRSTKAVLYDVADQIAKMPDGLQKTAIAVEIFGRAGAEMIPLLNGGSAGMREMDEMARKLGLTIDAETGKKAEQFNDTLDLIGMGSQGVANRIMAQLLPTLTSLAGSFLESMTSGDKLANTAAVLGSGLKILYTIGLGVVEVFSTVGKTIGAAAGQIIAILQGDFAGARRIGEEWARDMSSSWSDTAKAISRAWSDEGNAAVTAAATTMAAQKDLLAAAKAREAAGKAAAAAAKKEAEAYAALVAKIGGKSSGTDADFLKNLKLLADGGKKAGLSLAEIMKLQEAYIAQQPYMVAQAKARTKAEEDAKKAVDALYESRMALFKQAEANEQKAQEMLAQFQFEAKLIGLTNEERTVAIALRQLEATGIDKTTEAYQKLRGEIEQQVRGNAQAEAGIEAAEKVQKEWEETNRQIGESFVDNLMRGGKSVAQYLKDLFRTLVLRPILAPIGSAVAGVAGAALGMPAAAQGVGGSLAGSAAGSAAGSWLGSTMAGGSFLSGVSGASAALAGGSTFGVTGAIGSIPAAIGTGGTGLAGAAGSMGAGVSGALGAIPVWGWALMAGLAIASLAKGGETRSGGAYSDTSFLQGPSGGEINAEATRTAIGSTMQGINEMLRALGSTAQLANLQSGFESSKHGKGFAYAGGQLSTGAVFGQGVGGLGWQNRRGSMTPEEAATAFGEELKQATLQALQEAGVPGILGDYLRSLGDIDALSGGALDAALGRIQQALSEKQALEEQMLTLQSTDLENLTRARERERKALDESNWALYDQVTALMDQKAAAEAAAAAQREIDQERYGLETRLLQLQGNTAGLRRRELEAINPANRALQEYIWTLQDAAVEADKAQAATEKAMQAHRQYANDLREFRTSLFLGSDSPLRLNDRTDLAQRQLDVTIAKAQDGDLDAIAQLQADGTAYLAALKNSALTKFDYSLGVARVAAGLTITAAKSDATATAAQSQLDVMTSQLTALGVLTDVTQQGFAALLANYVGAKNNAAAAGAVQLDQSLTNGVTLGDGTFLSPDFLSSTMGEFQQMNAIQGLYMDTFGRAADREGLEYHMAQLDRGVTYDQLAAQFAQARLDGSHADGLDYVPFDGYRAELHRGERVLSMSDNAALTSAIERMAVQIEQQGRQIDALVTHSYQSRKHLQEVVERGVGVYNAPGETLETVAA